MIFTKTRLKVLQQQAHRRNMWYTTLSQLERSVMELTITYVDEVKSVRLSRIIRRIVCKLVKAFQSSYLKRVYARGSRLAAALSHLAQQWGHHKAASWQRDPTFIRFLGTLQLDHSSKRMR
jgi:hypothetical protein